MMRTDKLPSSPPQSVGDVYIDVLYAGCRSESHTNMSNYSNNQSKPKVRRRGFIDTERKNHCFKLLDAQLN